MGHSSSKRLNPAIFEDLSDNTAYSVTEIRAWHRDFMKDCPDGYLTLENFKTEYAALFPQNDTNKFATHVFRTFDVDQDGALNFREFILALNSLSNDEPQNKLEWIFRLYDVEGTGYITRQEVKQIANCVDRMFTEDSSEIPSAEQRVHDFFSAIDKDENDIVTYEEFIEAAVKDSWLSGFLQNKTFDQIVAANESEIDKVITGGGAASSSNSGATSSNSNRIAPIIVNNEMSF